MSEAAKDLIKLMTTLNPFSRPSAAQCLQHHWFEEFYRAETELHLAHPPSNLEFPLESDPNANKAPGELKRSYSLKLKKL